MAKNFTELTRDLEAKRKQDLKALRKILKECVPPEIKESFSDDQLHYTLPMKYYPYSYQKRPLLYAALSNRKSYISLNLISIFNDKSYRDDFGKRMMATGVCAKASGCCYQIKTMNADLEKLLRKELKRMNTKKFIATFDKYRAKESK